jgi:hypothetical protein
MTDPEQLLAEATPRPWRVKKYDSLPPGTHGVVAGEPSGERRADFQYFVPNGEADAALIVYAVNNLESLLAAARAGEPRDYDGKLHAQQAALRKLQQKYETVKGDLRRCREALEDVGATLERIAEQQPKTLAMIQRNGFKFEDIGNEPGNWQHLAFSIYTDLCEVDSIARAALRSNQGEADD